MHNLAVFDKNTEEDEISESLRELIDFMEQPHSIGLDSFKESLRNIVQLMMELKGYDTGYALQHLMFGEHSSMSMEGLSPEDRKKKKKLQEFWEDINAIIAEMSKSVTFDYLFTRAQDIIVEIKEDINEKIAGIDTVIEEKADTEQEAQAMKANNAKRKKLVKFKKHIKNYKEELHEVDTSKEVLEIQKSVIEDAQDFKDGVFVHGKPKPNPLGILGDAITVATTASVATNDAVYDNTIDPKPDVNNKDKSKTDSSDSAGDSSSGSGGDTSGDSSSSGDSGKKEEGTKPDLPDFDF